MEIYETLKEFPLFKDLDRCALWSIAGLAQIKKFTKDEILIHEGEKGKGCYFITSGKVEILKAQPDGTQRKVVTLGVGEIVGEISIIDDEPTTATAKVLEPVDCLFIGEWDFKAQMQASPEIALQLVRILAKRLRALYEY